MRLAGKVAIITGAARGQGAAAARRFVAEGAQVLIADVADEAGKALADELGPAATYQHLDVSSEDDWVDAVRAAGELGRINVLVNNAGVLHFSELADTSLADYERVIRVNQVGTFLGMREVVPAMSDGGGSVINVSSVEGIGGMPLMVAYAASKFAIRGMTKVAAVELGRHGIRVNSVHPGAIDTRMIPEAVGGEVPMDQVGKRVALGRVGQPEEIADLVVFLASDESSYCTGAEFVADGGATATHALA
ncbi:glucose 1-dehydrogenase [Saccharopolyspora sp. NPDC000359]|uniref:glucose 1-dehydrogenase n=1 Tax=Saccharopolyspora sp. NPDC000359 TaxID=3154251 RepID=UPI00332B385E